MNLWILRPIEKPENDDPWEPWYDKCFGFVVRAETESEARQYAQDNAGDEKRGYFLGKKTANTKTPWLDENYSTCEPLTADGDAGLVMCDFHDA